MNINATLNLEQSLETFQHKILPLLSIGDLSSWDGEELKKREEAIREASLVLGGECIAQLLHEISENPTAQKEAKERTQTSQGFGTQRCGKKNITILTLGNVQVRLKVSYCFTPSGSSRKRKRKAGERGKASGQSFYPLLRWLSLEERITPMIWTNVASQGMLSNSFAAAQSNLQAWGIELSEQRIERLTYRFGQIGIALSEQWMAQMEQGELPTGETFKGQRVCTQVDGGRTRLRKTKRGRRKASGRKGYHGKWREPKLFTIYALDESGERLNTLALPITNDGTFGDVEVFISLLEMYLVKLGIVHATQVLLVCDGAPWIWQRIPALLQKLGVPSEQIVELIDFYHATEHLAAWAELAFGKTAQAQQWFKTARLDLKAGKLEQLLAEMLLQQMSCPSQKKRQELEKAMSYFKSQPHRFAYAKALKMNLPIGSGAIESLIRQVVNLRLKGNGKFWLEEHAEIMLHGRCQWAAGAWNEFCSRVLTAKLDVRPLMEVDQEGDQVVAA